MYTLTHRDQLYDALLKMIKVLMFNLGPGGPQTLPGNLLEQLVHAGVRAPGFSERQKWGLMMFSGFNPDQFNISPQSRTWPFQTLGRKADAEEDTLKVGHHLLAAWAFIYQLLIRWANSVLHRSSTPGPCPTTSLILLVPY